jgi:hypothetical protein
MMTASTAQDWREKFAEIESCPWPGPRPLRYGDNKHLLCGRDEDIARFLTEVDSYRVIFLTGNSGVGKTSLLRRGLVPELEKRGYLVAVCRDWSGAASALKPAEFLSERVAQALHSRLPDMPSDTSIMRELAEQYGDRAVLILDQFEELIRDARGFTQQLFDALASLNKYSNIKIIISLRSEHLHELRPLEHRVQPFSTTYFYLEPVEARFIRDIIDAGNETSRLTDGRDAIERGASEAIHQAWESANRIENTLNYEPPGLLGLQALLYVLNERAKGQTVTPAEFARFEQEMGTVTSDPQQAARMFSLALSEAAEAKLKRCRDASLAVNLDPALIEGAMSVLARSVQHLTSGGYKLVRNVWDVVNLAMEDELGSLTRGAASSRGLGQDGPDGPLVDGQLKALFNVIVQSVLADGEADVPGDLQPDQVQYEIDFLSASRRELSAAADEAAAADESIPAIHLGWEERLNQTAQPFLADPLEVTAGPLMGRAPAEVLIEELRRFALALQWLRASYLVRISQPAKQLMMIALIHDGFGSALERWAAEQTRGPSGAIRALTARGDAYRWSKADGTRWDAFDGEGKEGGAQLVNLRWRGGIVADTRFRQVSFINCDLRGVLFANCEFEGVSFINCVMDGMMLSDCKIAGEPSDRPKTYATGARAFRIDHSAEEADLIARYRDLEKGSSLLSAVPGLPAVPAKDGDTSLEVLKREAGSVVVRGGRTAALSLRSLHFDDKAKFCLRDSAGSGFDVIEQDSAARFEISGCVLRHASFTTSPNRAEGQETADEIVIEAFGSAIFQAWIGDDLKGSFAANDCTLLHIWNGSPEPFTATAGRGSTYHGLVGVIPDESCTPLVPGEPKVTVRELDGDGFPRGRIVAPSLLMDYRRSSEDDEEDLANQQEDD